MRAPWSRASRARLALLPRHPPQLEHDPDALEWIFQMPLRHALSEYWLSQAAFEPARQEAKRLCELAVQPGERTYLALGKAR